MPESQPGDDHGCELACLCLLCQALIAGFLPVCRVSALCAGYRRLVNGGKTDGPGLVRDDPGQLEHEDGDDTDEDKRGGPGDAFEFLVFEFELAEGLAGEIKWRRSHSVFLPITRNFRPLHVQPAFSREASPEGHGELDRFQPPPVTQPA